jgi:hypothetical protein
MFQSKFVILFSPDIHPDGCRAPIDTKIEVRARNYAGAQVGLLAASSTQNLT